MSYFAVIREAGSAWTDGAGTFEQPGVNDHAAFMNTLPMQEVGTDSGGIAYMVAKRMVSSFMHDLARELAPRQIRAQPDQ